MKLMNNPLTDNKWYVVYTCFRHEKSAMNALLRLGIEAYVPVLNKTKRYKRKIKHYEIPLISHYVFVRLSKTDFKQVIQVKDVIRFLGTGKNPSIIPDHEIQMLKAITGDLADIELLPFDPEEPGQSVEIIGGALTGLKGKVIKSMGQDRLLVEFQNIGYSLSIEVPKHNLKAISRYTSNALSAAM